MYKGYSIRKIFNLGFLLLLFFLFVLMLNANKYFVDIYEGERQKANSYSLNIYMLRLEEIIRM